MPRQVPADPSLSVQAVAGPEATNGLQGESCMSSTKAQLINRAGIVIKSNESAGWGDEGMPPQAQVAPRVATADARWRQGAHGSVCRHSSRCAWSYASPVTPPMPHLGH